METLNKIKKYATVTVPMAIMLSPLASVLAQSQGGGGGSYGGGSGTGGLPAGVPGGVPITANEIVGRVTQLMRLLTGFGVVIGVIFIIIGGIQYMIAGGDETKLKAAKARLINGFIGVAIVVGVGVIIQTAIALVDRSALNF